MPGSAAAAAALNLAAQPGASGGPPGLGFIVHIAPLPPTLHHGTSASAKASSELRRVRASQKRALSHGNLSTGKDFESSRPPSVRAS